MTADPRPNADDPTLSYGAGAGGGGGETGDGGGAYPAAPEGLRWVPLLGGGGLLTAVVVAGAVAALCAFALITWLFVADDLAFHEQMSLAVLATGLVVLGVGLPLLVGEGARLQLAPARQVDANVRGLGPEPEAVEAVVKMMKGLTATRVAAAIGVLLIMTAAFLARPAEDAVGGDDDSSQVEEGDAGEPPGQAKRKIDGADGQGKAGGKAHTQGKSDAQGKSKPHGKSAGQGS